ncbi:MAG TPA: hypothetical protein VF818_07695 [Ktedonobacterales bacterium]
MDKTGRAATLSREALGRQALALAKVLRLLNHMRAADGSKQPPEPSALQVHAERMTALTGPDCEMPELVEAVREGARLAEQTVERIQRQTRQRRASGSKEFFAPEPSATDTWTLSTQLLAELKSLRSALPG